MINEDDWEKACARVKLDLGARLKSELLLPALANFIHGCSKDPNTRTNAVTLLVTSLCQLGGRAIVPQMPSTVVINGHDITPDAFDPFASFLVANPKRCEPKVKADRASDEVDEDEDDLESKIRDPKKAAARMEHAMGVMKDLEDSIYASPQEKQDQENFFFTAQRDAFGYGLNRNYAEAWLSPFGLLTDRSDKVILRIDSPQDRAAFTKDVTSGATKLRQPAGIGNALKTVGKEITISGFFPVSLLDEELVRGIIDLGIPFLFLPSVAKEAPKMMNETSLKVIVSALPKDPKLPGPVEEPANLFPDPWYEHYGEELRQRLRHFPATYDYAILKMLRQLFLVCLLIAEWCGKLSGSSTEEVIAVAHDLCGHATRGMALSTAGLAWYGLGIDAGCSHENVTRVLEYLRTREPMTKSELLRGAHLTKEERDRLVECFAAEDLIRVEGKIVAANSYPEFVERLHARTTYPQPVNHWAKLKEKAS